MTSDPQNNDEPTQRPPSSMQESTEEKVRAFAAAREMANAQTRQLLPSLGQHVAVIALGLLVIAFWAGTFALRSCSCQPTPATPSTESTITRP